MTDELAAVFARIHAEYRNSVGVSVRNLSDEGLAAAAEMFQADEEDWRRVSFKALPDDVWPVAPRVRAAIRRELERRAAEARADKETEA